MKYFKAPMLSMNFSESEKGIKKRFYNILDNSKKHRGILALSLVVLGVFLLGVLVGCSGENVNVQNLKGYEIAADLENAIIRAIFKENCGRYLEGECTAEGHIILDTDVTENGDGTSKVTAYTLITYGEYGFENGIFTKVSGSGVIPTRITYNKSENGYTLLEYKPAEDGSRYTKSIKEMFPKNLVNRALNSTDEDYEQCLQQEYQYAKVYLISIGREAKIDDNVDRDLPNMNVETSNKLIDLFNEYPYWIGTEEKIENDVRYVYEKSWEDKGNGNGIVSFMKYEYDSRNVTEETVIEVNGGELNYIKGEVRTKRR